MRACQATSAKAVSMPDLVKDVAELRGALQGELATIAAAAAAGTSGGGGGWAGNALWLGADEAEAAATALLPKLASAREATQALLFEVVALEVGVFPSSCVLPGLLWHSILCFSVEHASPQINMLPTVVLAAAACTPSNEQ